jgi:hypothetical protein
VRNRLQFNCLIAVFVLACGRAEAPRQGEVTTPSAPDASTPVSSTPDASMPDIDGGPDAGPADSGPADAGPADAGVSDAGPPDAGADAGSPDAGVDAGPAVVPGTITVVPDNTGWQFAGDGLPADSVMGASSDEGGNLWVAGGSAGVFVQRGGSGAFRGFGIGDGLHPYGSLTGNIARARGVPDGTPSERSPSLDATPVISVSGGPPGVAFIGYQGKPGCEDEWDSHGETLADHASADPSIYKSGDADKIVLAGGGGVGVWHFDIYSGEGVVPNEPIGREKICTIHRILYEHGTNRVWLGGNHGFAYGFADSATAWEHVHPGINDVHNWMMTDAYLGIALDTVLHLDSAGLPVHDVWFGGMIRTTRFRFGETGGDYWKAQPLTEQYGGGDISQDPASQAAYWNRIDVWPDPVGERWDPPRDWHSREPDALNPAHWNYDNVTGIAVLKNGDAWISSHTNGLRRLNHDGKFVSDATAWLPGRSIGAIASDPLDDSVWIGFREPGLGIWRLRTDGTLLQYGAAALGGYANSAVWDIQITPGPGRRVVIAFRRGAVGVYQGN